ncbi:MAG: phytanoyl-CoA hydroxylase [Candidatus Latescibacterota bacterium]|jgi:phytanoyl-CoA hydroxylase
MELPSASYEHYWHKGWCVVENVFGAEEIDRITALAMEISQREMDTSSNYAADRSEDGAGILPRKIGGPFDKHEDFRTLVLDQHLRKLTGALLGDEALLATDQIFMKPPRFGSEKPYHQDNAYFLCTPSDGVITAWIALDDVDEENGCMRYIDGSHQEPILPHEAQPGSEHNKVPPIALIDLARESLALVRKGGVVFHHSQCLHTSHRNESDRWRRAYATHWVTPAVEAESAVLANAYFQRPDYDRP